MWTFRPAKLYRQSHQIRKRKMNRLPIKASLKGIMLTLMQRTEAVNYSSSPSLLRTGSSKQRSGRTQTWVNFTTGYRSSATLAAIHTNSKTFSFVIGRISSTMLRSCLRRKSSSRRQRKAPQSNLRIKPWKFNQVQAKKTSCMRSLHHLSKCQD